jgi:hypothetical protein
MLEDDSAGSFRLLEREPMARINLDNSPHNRSARFSVRWAIYAADRLEETEDRGTRDRNTLPGNSSPKHLLDNNVNVKRQRALPSF